MVDGKSTLAHRHIYARFVGPIPDGLHVLHKCDIRCCVNPAHLFLGTNADNVADCKAKGRNSKGERQGQSKLTDAQVVAIRADTRTNRTIATEYGIAYSIVGYIKRRVRWRHVSHYNCAGESQ